YMWPSKQSPYDKGLRTVMMYKWPGYISPMMDTTHFVSSIDMVPTALAATGMEPTNNMKGVNILDLDAVRKRKAVFAMDSHHDMVDVNAPEKSLEHRIVLKRPWKLILPVESVDAGVMTSGGGGSFISVIETPELYNIVLDPYEENEGSATHPDV